MARDLGDFLLVRDDDGLMLRGGAGACGEEFRGAALGQGESAPELSQGYAVKRNEGVAVVVVVGGGGGRVVLVLLLLCYYSTFLMDKCDPQHHIF